MKIPATQWSLTLRASDLRQNLLCSKKTETPNRSDIRYSCQYVYSSITCRNLYMRLLSSAVAAHGPASQSAQTC